MRSMLHQDPFLALRCDTLDFLVKTGGGYYFFLEFKDRRIYFSNNIHTLCDVVRDGETSGTLEDCLRVLYPWDVPDLRTQYRALADGRQKEMSAEFRLITRTGDVVRVSCQGHVQSDGQNRRWMIGSLTEISSVSKAGQFSGSQNMDYLKEETDLMLRREEDVAYEKRRADYVRVRAMMDDKGNRVKEAGPSTPVEILGLNDVPNAGEVFVALPNEKEARSFAETFITEGKNKLLE